MKKHIILNTRYLCAALTYFYLSVGVYSQDGENSDASKGVSENSPAESIAPADALGSKENSPTAATENAGAVASQTVPAAPIHGYVNPAVQQSVHEQFRWTPEDPSFLYEPRNIPDHKNASEFLSTELEKVVIKEQIQEEINFTKSLGKIKIRLPDLTQTLVLVSIIIIVLVYRNRARRPRDARR